ncbi:MAG: dienelactone hydrolase family protein [Candidatus Cloacimonetes bacterium]|nr:dienelactone hydrolase family protein [Candidatus Cloacimonadota bacterium]
MNTLSYFKGICLFIILILFCNIFALSDTEADSLLSYNYTGQIQRASDLYNKGQFEESLDLYLKTWQNNYDDSNTLYNIACLYGLLNKGEMAGKFLQEAVSKGFADYEHTKNDKDFDLVRNDPAFLKYWTKLEDYFKNQKNIHGEISYLKTEVKIRYRTVLPDNFDPNKSYKLLIGLHGFGGNHYRFIEMGKLLKNEDIIFVTPQAPYPMEFTMGMTTSFSWNIFDFEETPSRDYSGDLSAQYILKLTKELKKKYKLKGVYLSGFSQGGFMTLAIGLINYKDFDGLISIGGGIFDERINDKVIKKAKSIPVLIIHGKNDKTVEFSHATEANNQLKKAGYDVTLQAFEGAHTVPAEEFLKAIEWIKAH